MQTQALVCPRPARARFSLACALLAFIFLLLTATPLAKAQAQINVPITVQEAIWPGVSGVNRTADTVTVGIPLRDADNITAVTQLGIQGAAAGQFRVLGRWPSGNIKWVLVDTQVSVTAGSVNQSIALVRGSGNFGGSDLATDNGSTITVNTGPAQFTIRKARYNGFDQVVVNGRTLVTAGASKGVVLMGPVPGGTTCPPCTTEYASSNDASSNAEIEENGPVRTVVKATGSHRDAAGNAYMKFTARMYFYKGKTHAKVVLSLRNADDPITTFDAAYKGFQSYEFRVTPTLAPRTLGNSTSFSFGNETPSPTTGSFAAAEDAYLYQAYSNDMEDADWRSPSVVSYIPRNLSTGPYLQEGFQIVQGSTVIKAGEKTTPVQGWADVSDASGAGMTIGVYNMSAYWPKSLELVGGGTEARVGVWPSQDRFTGGGGVPYYQAWPQYSTHDLYFDFHDTAAESASTRFLRFQHYLLGRAPVAHYNASGVFLYPLLEASVEDQWYRDLATTYSVRASNACCIIDQKPQAFRFKGWANTGGPNQVEARDMNTMRWLSRGMTGRYLHSAHFYRHSSEQTFVRSDGFSWRNKPASVLDVFGTPLTSRIVQTNISKAHRSIMDQEHAHWYGMTYFYFLTGDWAIYEQLLDGAKDRFLNPDIPYIRTPFNPRSIGGILAAQARMYDFLSTIGDAEANIPLQIGENVINMNLVPSLIVNGFGDTNTGGRSFTRGFIWPGKEFIGEPDGTRSRIVTGFQHSVMLQGVYEYAKVRGPTWSGHEHLMDVAFGASQWMLTEMFVNTGQYSTSGWRYINRVDKNNASEPWMQIGVRQIHHLPFLIMHEYTGNVDSWKQAFDLTVVKNLAGIGIQWTEYAGYTVTAPIERLLNPASRPTLVDVPITATNNGNGSYTLRWTVPNGALGYRIKYAEGKTIVENLNFNPMVDPAQGFGVDPTLNTPWFSATNVTNEPAPGTPGTAQTHTVSGLDPTKSYNFAMKAYLTSSAPPPPPRDSTAPTVSISSLATGATVNGTVTVQATASDNTGVAGVQFFANNAPIGAEDTTAPYSASWATGVIPNGTHTLTARARDAAGNQTTSAAVVVNVQNTDTQAPTVTMTSPANGASVSGNIVLIASASDDVGVVGVQFIVDGVSFGVEDTAAPFSVSLATTTLANGTHTVAARARDLQGNQTTSAANTFTVNNASADTVAPTISITAPANGAAVQGSIAYSATATDNVGVAGVRFFVDGVQVGAEDTTAPYGVTLNTVTLANGARSLRATARDAGGNQTSATITVTVNNPDTTPPTVSVTSPGAGSTVAGAISLVASASDNVGVASVQFLVDGSPAGAADTAAPFSISLDTTTLSNGSHTVSAVARDAANNATTSAGITVNVNNVVADTTAPSVSVTSPANGSTIQGSISFTAAASDNVGVTGVRLFIDGNAVGAEITAAPFSATVDTTSLGNGTHVFSATARDAAGNQTTAISTVTVNNPDVTAPAVSVTSPTNGSTVAGTISLVAAASDNIGVASVQFLVDGANFGAAVTAAPYSVSLDTTTLSNGAHTITATARDAANNATNSSAVTINVNNVVADTTAPTVSVTSPANGSTIQGSISFTATASDNVGVTGVRLFIDGTAVGSEMTSGPFTASVDTTTLANGSHIFSATARDAAGNQTTATSTVTVNNPDITAPTVAVTSPAGGSTVAGTISLVAAASDNIGVASVQFLVDGAALGAAVTSAPFSVSLDTTTLSNGAHTVNAVARDVANNATTSASVAITVNNVVADTTPPTVSITAPANGASVQGNVTINATASDETSLAGVRIFVNGTPLGAELTAAPFTATWDTLPLANGAHTISATARDSAGNQATTAITVTVSNPDVTAPTVALTSPTSGTTVAGTISLVASAGDNIGIAAVQFLVDGAPFGAEVLAVPYTVDLDTLTLVNGPHTLQARARDAAGNITTSAAVSITVNNADVTPPAVGITSPTPNATIQGTATVAVTATDNRGVAAVSLFIDGSPVAELTAAPFNFTVNTTTLTNAAHVITATARDAAGNQASATVNVTVFNPDTTGPVVVLTSPSAGSTVAQTINVLATATDNIAVAGVQFLVDGVNFGPEITSPPYAVVWNTTAFANGQHTLAARARDAAGNVTTTAAITVTVNNVLPDTAAPTVSVISPVAGVTLAGEATIAIAATDDVGVAGVQILLDGAPLGAEITSPPYARALNTTTLANGAHTVSAIARDTAGNTATAPPVTVLVNNAAGDTTPPTVVVTTPQRNTTVTGTITLVANATDNIQVASVTFLIDGIEIGTVLNPEFDDGDLSTTAYPLLWNTRAVPNGTHTISARATDTAGNTATATSTVNVGNAGPGSINQTQTDANTQYRVQLENLGAIVTCPQCRFNSQVDIILGQTLEVRLRSGGTTAIAEQIVLKMGVITGTVSATRTGGFQFTPDLPAVYPARIDVLTGTPTQFVGFQTPTGPVAVGQRVAVRGLLFKEVTDSSLPEMAAATVELRQ